MDREGGVQRGGGRGNRCSAKGVGVGDRRSGPGVGVGDRRSGRRRRSATVTGPETGVQERERVGRERKPFGQQRRSTSGTGGRVGSVPMVGDGAEGRGPGRGERESR